MSILVEFGISAARFELGRLINAFPELTAELERIVPTGNRAVPYVWVSGPAEIQTELVHTLEESELVTAVEILDDLDISDTSDRQWLYRIEWDIGELDIIRGIVESEGEILEGQNADGWWTLRFRFQAHENMAEFYQFLTDNKITEFSIDSIYELKNRSDRGSKMGLTPEQREALILAVQQGYFETPRQVTLAEVGEELGITQQAASERIRRATRNVVYSSLNIPNR